MTFNPNEVFAYTPEKLRSMTYREVKSIRDKSQERGLTKLCEWCQFEITRREPPPFEKHAPCVFDNEIAFSDFQKQICEKVIAFAFALQEKFDFSEETANEYSKPKFSNFRAHKLLGTNNEPKTGGGTRDGSYKMDRYISWRYLDSIYSLTILLPKDAPVSEAVYHVYAPQELIGENYKAVANLRSKLDENDELGLVKGGAVYKTLNEAMDVFEKIMYQVAPRK